MILHDLLSKQITHLIVDITPTANLCSENFAKNLVLILSLCGRLTDLNFCEVFLTRKCWISIYPVRSTDYMSSTLVKLKINVSTFVDCLYLLDGRLSSLSTLIINVASIFDPVINIGRTVSRTLHDQLRSIYWSAVLQREKFQHSSAFHSRRSVPHFVMMISLFHYCVEWQISKNCIYFYR